MSEVAIRRSWCGAALITAAFTLAFAASAAAEDIIYFHQDALGSVRLVTGRGGEVLARYDYLPFGEEVPAGQFGRAPEAGYGAAQLAPQHFTGKERDTESGLDYFGARYYSGAMGRFVTPDEPFIGQHEDLPQTWNLYAYTSNSPLHRVDEDGRDWYVPKDGSGRAVWVSCGFFNDGKCPEVEGYTLFTPKSPEDYIVVEAGFAAGGLLALGVNADGTPWIGAGQLGSGLGHPGGPVEIVAGGAATALTKPAAAASRAVLPRLWNAFWGAMRNGEEGVLRLGGRMTARETARELGSDLVRRFKVQGVGNAAGRSGGHGDAMTKAGAELIRLANQTADKELREAMKIEARRLVQRGKSVSHK